MAQEDSRPALVAVGPWEDPPPSHRRPPRDDAVTYRLRIDLDRAKPPLWRRLEVASDLYLDELHWIIQVAFGWDNSHLHQFSAETPEEEVRLDEVLVDPGDKLSYEYDVGDGRWHTINLEAVPGHRPIRFGIGEISETLASTTGGPDGAQS